MLWDISLFILTNNDNCFFYTTVYKKDNVTIVTHQNSTELFMSSIFNVLSSKIIYLWLIDSFCILENMFQRSILPTGNTNSFWEELVWHFLNKNHPIYNAVLPFRLYKTEILEYRKLYYHMLETLLYLQTPFFRCSIDLPLNCYSQYFTFIAY